MSKAHEKAVAKYNATNYERITFRLSKQDAQTLRDHVGNGSLNGFITSAVLEKIDREKLRDHVEIIREPFTD